MHTFKQHESYLIFSLTLIHSGKQNIQNNLSITSFTSKTFLLCVFLQIKYFIYKFFQMSIAFKTYSITA